MNGLCTLCRLLQKPCGMSNHWGGNSVEHRVIWRRRGLFLQDMHGRVTKGIRSMCVPRWRSFRSRGSFCPR
jgi:hypothetical protein